MGEGNDRRARRKAQTRVEIRTAAQELFAQRGFDAVTIADVAARADVAVQTVFNHFSTKEELFFADRTPWVDGPADAVRSRAEGVLPLAALRAYSMDAVHGFIRDIGTPERRRVLELLLASSALRAFERELRHRTETRLADALAKAWSQSPTEDGRPVVLRLEVRMAASLTAALWVSAASSLSLELRDETVDHAQLAAAVERMADRVFAALESSLGRLVPGAGGPPEEPSPVPRGD